MSSCSVCVLKQAGRVGTHVHVSPVDNGAMCFINYPPHAHSLVCLEVSDDLVCVGWCMRVM